MYEYYTRWTAPRWTWHNGESGTIPVIVPDHVGAEAKNRSASVRNRNAATEYVKVNIWKYSYQHTGVDLPFFVQRRLGIPPLTFYTPFIYAPCQCRWKDSEEEDAMLRRAYVVVSHIIL